MAEDIQLHFKFMLYSMSFPIITALVKNNIAEKLQELPKTVEELCESTPMLPEKLFRYLRAISSLGLFSYDPSSKKWSNTKDSILLTTPTSHCLWDWHGTTFVTEMFIHSEAQLTSSKSPQETLGRPPIFELIANNAELFQTFQKCMTGLSNSNSKEVTDSIIIDSTSNVLDVGGADGTLAINLARKHPSSSFGVFDRPEVCSIAQANIEKNQLGERVKFFGGSFFEEVPSGFNCIVMKHIIHDWSDENSRLILKNCRKALKEGDKLFIVEHLVDENSEYYLNTLALDHLMLMCVHGKERRLEEFKELLDFSGFQVVTVRPALFEVAIECKAI
jgi:precorrin-6B methylase 2